MKKITQYLLSASFVAVAGCASQPQLSDSEVASRYPQIGELQVSLQNADDNHVDLLSASLYQQASKQYSESLSLAKNGNAKAVSEADLGKVLIEKATLNAQTARDELAIAINARNRAISAGADKKNLKGFELADAELVKLGNWIAKGEIADVRESRQALAQRYAKLEIDALKNATASDAQARIQDAVRRGAENYAPYTLNLAQNELTLANRVLETDADARSKAAAHAQRAYQFAGQAIQVTEIIKNFKQSDMTDEQIVLWHQTQLANAVAPVVPNPDFSLPNKALINGLTMELQSVVNDAAQTKQSLAQIQQQLASEVASTKAEQQRQAEFESRYRTIQNIFTSDEAEVYRQGNNVLVRSYGFSFPSGGSEIRSENFPLLKKIISAIGQFPNSQIQISGHTDNRGSDELNMNLSSDRAEKVAQFLVQVGNIQDTRVNSIGYGKTRPVASNETADGRAANRRVEILIVND